MVQRSETTNTSGHAQVSFILVRPQFLGNIGSVARVIKNFGFTDLRFVEPPRNYKDAEARKMAVAAFDVLKKSTTYSSFSDAIEDLHFVVGTSSGQQRKEPLQPFDLAINSMPTNSDARVGIAFGDEVDGLRRDELNLCNIVATIPTNPDFPSLNLAQAVGLTAYELSKPRTSAPQTANENNEILQPTAGEIAELFEQLSVLMNNVDFARPKNEAQVLADLRQFFFRAGATKRETDLLRGIMHKLNQSVPGTPGRNDVS